MNILVLGNGFDLAHGLKTSYRNFLDAVNITNTLLSCENPLRSEIWKSYDKSKIPIKLCERLEQINNAVKHEDKELRCFHIGWKYNFWFKYFADKEGTWIDFERSISEVCKYIEKSIYNNEELKNLEKEINITIELSLLQKYFNDTEEVNTFLKVLDKLEKDLKELINSLDIYIYKFINLQKCRDISPDIISLEIDKVISFNYSATYQSLYNIRNNVEFDYIHGKAGKTRNQEYSNLVLGYDESNSKLSDDVIPLLASFKKYYQRVLKETDNEYVKWVESIKSENNKIHTVYFFGHSMDITDKDILRALILNNNVISTIYYYCNSDKMRKLKNLVTALGYNEFLWYTKNGNIKLKLQKNFNNMEYSVEYWSKYAVKNLYKLPYITNSDYDKITTWFNKICTNPYKYKIKYIYMTIDALQKYQLELERIEVLIKNFDKYKDTLYNNDDFKDDYPNYCVNDTNYENELIIKLINTNYEKQIKKQNTVYERLLGKIQCDKKTWKNIINENGTLCVNLNKLNKVIYYFLGFFDNDQSYPEVYMDMTQFLVAVDIDLVKKMFLERLNDTKLTNVNRNRIQVLQSKYDMLRKESRNIKDVHYRK